MKLGNYHFLVNEKHRNPLRMISQEESRVLEERVDELTGILGNEVEWALGGGLAIALTVGRFYRNNSDADILVTTENIDALANQARKKGYDLFLRLADIKLSPRMNLYIYRQVSQDIARKANYENLKLIRVDENNNALDGEGLLDAIEVFPYRKVNDDEVSTEKGFSFPLDKMFQTGYKTFSGIPITLSSPEYLIRIKEFFIAKKKDKPRQKDVFDLKILREFVTKREQGRI